MQTMVKKGMLVKSKRSQLKIQQMAFMLMAVTLFFLLVGLFVIVIKFSGLKQKATDLEEENAKLLLSKLSNSPEFSCGDAFNYGKVNCIDSDKVMILKENIAKYNGFWGVASIEIRKIYPKSSKDIECTLNSYPNCNIIKVYSKKVNSGAYKENFVSLCRKDIEEGESYDRCEMAKILISYEVKS